MAHLQTQVPPDLSAARVLVSHLGHFKTDLRSNRTHHAEDSGSFGGASEAGFFLVFFPRKVSAGVVTLPNVYTWTRNKHPFTHRGRGRGSLRCLSGACKIGQFGLVIKQSSGT